MPVVLRQAAQGDVEAAIDYYAREAGKLVADRFVDSLEASIRAISRNPATGSPRYASELGFPGLRMRATPHFPYLLFYVERVDLVDVWRVLHAHRDLAAWLRGPY